MCLAVSAGPLLGKADWFDDESLFFSQKRGCTPSRVHGGDRLATLSEPFVSVLMYREGTCEADLSATAP